MPSGNFLNDDDGVLEDARILLNGGDEELEARILAQALRLHHQAVRFTEIMHQQNIKGIQDAD